MSIKRFVALCLTAIGAFLILLAVLLFIGDWHDYRAARDADQLVSLLGATTKISETLSPERGATSVALDGDPAARKALADCRTTADAAFDAVEAVATATSRPEGKETAEAVAKMRGALNGWRSKTDALAGGDPQKVAAFRKDFFSGLSDILNAASTLTTMLERRLIELDALVATPASLAETTWQLRDNAGRLATMHLTAITSGKPFTEAAIREIDVADGRVQQLWESLTAQAGSPDSPAGMRDGIAKVQSAFFLPFKQLLEHVAKSGQTGDYDIDPPEWRRQSGPMLQAIMVMRDAAIAEAHRIAAEKSQRTARDLVLLGALLTVAAATLVGVIVGINYRVIAPLGKLTAVIGEFAAGSRDFNIPFVTRSDETGNMAKAIEVLRDNAREADRRAAQEADATRARDQHRQRIEQVTADFVDSIDAVMGGVAGAVDSLRTATGTLTKTSTITTEQSAVVANSAERASANVQTVAAAAEELSNSIQEISRRVSETAAAADGAVREAEDTNGTVRGLAEAARRIGDVVNLINDIASQTNLLALNATIEAARAGDAGKGFAVVAGEVKSLANQTARATDDIQAQVAAIQAETDRAVAAIGGIAKTISTVNQFTISIASAVEEQGAATQEIARNVQQASAGTSDVSQSIGRVLDAARQTGTAADQLSTLADQLANESGRLRGNVGDFVAEVKKG